MSDAKIKSGVRGYVIYWAEAKGHGKAMAEDGSLVFIHYRFFLIHAKGERVSLQEGQWLTFDIIQDPKGPRGASIEIEQCPT